MASIIVVSGPNAGNYYPLGSRTIVVGRGEGCPIQIVDDQVSRKHLQIRADAGRYIAMDMKSANGTLINGNRIGQEAELADGDEITLGDSKLSFCDQDFPDRESAFNHWKTRGERRRSTLVT